MQIVQFGSQVTAIILVLLIHGIIAWDVYAGLKWGKEATVSYVLNSWANERPVICLAFGVLFGHIFWPLR
jgi:hypothetical protein